MGLRNRLKALVECTLFGHEEFNTGTNTMPRIFQDKETGNKYHDFKVCSRCNTVYTAAGELNAAELAEEKRIEESNAALQARMEKVKEDLIKKFTEAKVQHDGKNALN